MRRKATLASGRRSLKNRRARFDIGYRYFDTDGSARSKKGLRARYSDRHDLADLNLELTAKQILPEEVPKVVAMMKSMHRVSPEAHHPFRQDHITHLLNNIPDDQMCATLKFKDDGMIIGFIAGYIMEHPFYELKASFDHAMWIDPAWRGLQLSKRLMTCFERWSKRKGCTEVYMSVMSGSPQSIHAISRWGYTGTPETTLRKEITPDG